MISIPLLQLIMFGYAINTRRAICDRVLLQESSDVGGRFSRRSATPNFST